LLSLCRQFVAGIVSVDLRLAGKRCVVTGGAGAIGQAICEELHTQGVLVVAIDSDEGAEARLQALGIPCVTSDLRHDPSGLAKKLLADFGPFQLVVNNMGIFRPAKFLEIDEDQLVDLFRVNLIAPWLFTRALVDPLLEHGKGGAIVFISSVHDQVPRGAPHYSGSKAAVSMVVKELALELSSAHIRVNAVSPGAIASSMTKDVPRDHRGRSLVPLERIGKPKDIAGIVTALLSDEVCGYVTGANIVVDGGLTLRSWAQGVD
jgi:NAD(P)-dependent dehydrogenase (short-subunit alcohol dehydrogenase family)